MPIRELVSKTLAFGLTAAALVVGGILVLGGNHAYTDYLDGLLGWSLIAMGVATAGLGVFLIGGIFYDARLRRQEEQVHVTPRVMSVTVSNVDGALLIVGLLTWTVLTLVFFAPTH